MIKFVVILLKLLLLLSLVVLIDADEEHYIDNHLEGEFVCLIDNVDVQVAHILCQIVLKR